MSGTRFAMVSGWMRNGNISQFVSANRDVNRFELVSLQFGFLLLLPLVNAVISVAGRCCGGLGSHARARNDSRGLERCTYSGARPTIRL